MNLHGILCYQIISHYKIMHINTYLYMCQLITRTRTHIYVCSIYRI